MAQLNVERRGGAEPGPERPAAEGGKSGKYSTTPRGTLTEWLS